MKDCSRCGKTLTDNETCECESIPSRPKTKPCLMCKMDIPADASICAFCKSTTSTGMMAAEVVGAVIGLAGGVALLVILWPSISVLLKSTLGH